MTESERTAHFCRLLTPPAGGGRPGLRAGDPQRIECDAYPAPADLPAAADGPEVIILDDVDCSVPVAMAELDAPSSLGAAISPVVSDRSGAGPGAVRGRRAGDPRRAHGCFGPRAEAVLLLGMRALFPRRLVLLISHRFALTAWRARSGCWTLAAPQSLETTTN